MYKTSLVLGVMLLFVGCGESKKDQTVNVSKSTPTKQTQVNIADTQLKTAPEADKKQESVKIETHAPKEEKTIAKVPMTTAPTPLAVKKVAEAKGEASTKIDASKIYVSCAGCHGSKGEKKALGKSELIGGWSKDKVVEALKGYRSGSRNAHGMGAVMKGQASKLTDEEIDALGGYISKLR